MLETLTSTSVRLRDTLRLCQIFPCAVFTPHPGSTSVPRFSETFESLLNLALFDSIDEAIDGALEDDILTERDAHEMIKSTPRCNRAKSFSAALLDASHETASQSQSTLRKFSPWYLNVMTRQRSSTLLH
jgi:hypothetical protein